jgi:hypothetical protein
MTAARRSAGLLSTAVPHEAEGRWTGHSERGAPVAVFELKNAQWPGLAALVEPCGEVLRAAEAVHGAASALGAPAVHAAGRGNRGPPRRRVSPKVSCALAILS